MPRLFLTSLSKDLIPGAVFNVKGADARYLSSVLRMKRGQELTVFGPDGFSVATEIASVNKGDIRLEVRELLPERTEPDTGMVLVQGILKGSKMEMVIQKAVELGVREVIPVVTERSQVRTTRKLDRWSRIAGEAARQCGRTITPKVRKPEEFIHFLNQHAKSRGLQGYIFHEAASRTLAPGDRLGSEDIYVAIGPEGGFTSDEVAYAEGIGLSPRGLGHNILRAETAAIAALAIVGFLSGRISQH